MKSRRFIADRWDALFFPACLSFICLFFSSTTAAQTYKPALAFVTPDGSSRSQAVRDGVETNISGTKILDDSLTESAITGFQQNFFNLSTDEAKNLGTVIGCDFLVLLKAGNLRRTSLTKGDYYESYVAVYLVSAKTGGLVFWSIKNFEAPAEKPADDQLTAALPDLAREISTQANKFYRNQLEEPPPPILEELPAEGSPEEKFRSPLPYKRLRPAYTPVADLYSIAATVDASVDLDENGAITRIEITRWAGYGLDESVVKTIREMNWRAASRDGKNISIRVLLRYNFKKVPKDE